MSSLSWLIYLVGLSDSVSNGLFGLILFFSILTIAFIIIKFVITINPNDREVSSVNDKYGKSISKWSLFVFTTLGVLILLQFIVPSKQTAVLIAASEVGQRVLQSKQAEVVGEKITGVLDPSVNLLETWIKKETINQQQQLEDMVKAHDSKK